MYLGNYLSVYQIICRLGRIILNAFMFVYILYLYYYDITTVIVHVLNKMCSVWLSSVESCASDSLHLNLLPQFNRQQRKKGREAESYKLLANLDTQKSPYCVSLVGNIELYV